MRLHQVQAFYCLRGCCGAVSACCEACFCDAVQSSCGHRIAILTFCFLAAASGMFHASVAVLPSSTCMYAVLLGFAAWLRKRFALGLACGSFAVLLGMAVAVPMFVPMGLAALAPQNLGFCRVLGIAIGALLFFAVLPSLVDWSYYGTRLPVWAMGNHLLYNFGIGGGGGAGADLYGTEPWTFYAKNLLLNFNLVALLALPALPCCLRRRQHAIVILPMYITLAMFTKMAHKEERFLTMLYPLLCLSAAMTVDTLLAGVEKVVSLLLREDDASCTRTWRTSKVVSSLMAAACVMVFAVTSVSRSAALHFHFMAPLQVYEKLYRHGSDALSFPAIAGQGGLCVGKEWYRFPSSFFLPSSEAETLPLLWVNSSFDGQLPRPFAAWPEGLWQVPPDMNDRNLREPSRYHHEEECSLLVDLVLQDQKEEPPDSATWEEMHCQPFLDSSEDCAVCFEAPPIAVPDVPAMAAAMYVAMAAGLFQKWAPATLSIVPGAKAVVTILVAISVSGRPETWLLRPSVATSDNLVSHCIGFHHFLAEACGPFLDEALAVRNVYPPAFLQLLPPAVAEPPAGMCHQVEYAKLMGIKLEETGDTASMYSSIVSDSTATSSKRTDGHQVQGNGGNGHGMLRWILSAGLRQLTARSLATLDTERGTMDGLPAILGKPFQPALERYCRVEPPLRREELQELKSLLAAKKTLDTSKAKCMGKDGKPTGTFSASAANAKGDHTGSSMFGSWLRDNCIIAWGLFYTDPEGPGSNDAVACLNSIARFLLKYQSHKMELVINGLKDVKGDEKTWMDRPHIRFIGETGLEDPKWYNHKQNDALGYFMWARTQLAWHKKLPFDGEHLKLMGQLFDYLRAIESWEDLDGGHWEEHSAVHASSIGPPLAAVKLFKKVAARDGFLPPCKSDTLDVLESNLQSALAKILPNEIIFPTDLARDSDSATVFLAYPLEVVDDAAALQIMDRLKKVMGHIGMCRYRKDSYWCKDYKEKVGDDPTKHFTDEELKERDRLLKEGEEAQWCLFDPMVSAFYGRMYQKTKDSKYLRLQQLFLARSLAAITGDSCPYGPWHCAEAYYLEKDTWVPNDDTPLVWTQVDLKMALFEMERSLALVV
ncbi:ALG9 [Symbiodinium pilosum]|uniref:Mannosyltransferase n=1 Tax=Symbiodinium pilosum TaxID=2952 RepID=A0A812N427_SYMPI|nr:ALG9 [Symbiodinium pilosum]